MKKKTTKTADGLDTTTDIARKPLEMSKQSIDRTAVKKKMNKGTYQNNCIEQEHRILYEAANSS